MKIAPQSSMTTQPPMAMGAASPPLDRWRNGRGANGLADGVIVEVGAFDRRSRLGGGAYRFTGGIATAHRGVEILVEHGGTAPAQALLDSIRGYVDTLGAGELRLLNQVEVVSSACPEDAYWRDRYKIPGYFVRALTGGGVTQFWRGDVRTMRVFHHEQAHLLDFAGNVPGRGWRDAVGSDDAVIEALKAAGWTLADLPIDRFDFDRDHLRLTPGGITGYAEFARSNGGTYQEDVAESIAWYKLGGRVGAIARATNAAGETRDLTFADLFPARAKLVAAALGRINSGAAPLPGGSPVAGDHWVVW